ncbi:MAG: RIP metalloprotease RseP [Verrucomicrobia bacterium]|jgi:regulator of sigma E protease|nr:MAG: RIP metalloprotease RseP [Verrucomicrobiota bacterium]
MSILKIIIVVLEALFALNLLIFVHELGHFLAARWRGLKVERFAIWFGKPIWSKTFNGVEYALGWIPAGGYVSLPQMATMEAIEGKTDEKAEQLPNVSPLDKIIVAFAGPLFSFLLAILFAVIVWQVGKPEGAADVEPVLGWVTPEGPAWKSGLRAGDKILEVDGHPIKTFGPPSQDSIKWRIITSEGTNIAVKYLRDGKEAMAYPTYIKQKTSWYERRALRQVYLGPIAKPVVGDVLTNSPAHLAGLKRGDEIVAINGDKILSLLAVEYAQELMTNKSIPPINLTVRRGTEEFNKEILAAAPTTPTNFPPIFGIVWLDKTNHTLTYPGPWEQIEASAKQIFATVGAVINKKNDIGVQQLGGAVMIIRVYTNFFQSEDGWRWVLWFSVVLNVNLAMLNMLPLPVLDGGHILLSFIEVVRRRAVNPKILNYIQSGFAILLIGFMAWIAFYDVGDWIRNSRSERRANEPIMFAPKK